MKGVNDIEFLLSIVTLIVGILVGYFLSIIINKNIIGSAKETAEEIVKNAKAEANTKSKEILFNAKNDSLRYKESIDKENKSRRNELNKLENRLNQREETLDRKYHNLEKKEEKVERQMKEADKRKRKAEELYNKKVQELESISELTHEEARTILMEEVEKETRSDAAKLVRNIENEARENAEKQANEIIARTIQRCSADHVAENTITIVNLPNDEMKGRIIGREGRNIRALETATGIEIIIDDTPEAVILSGFDPIRREICRLALERLILDGRIHPGRIEETVAKSKKEIEKQIKEEGEQACFETGIHNIHPELVKYLGRLKYRTSYGQNVLKHAIEVSNLAGILAGELDGNVKLAKRAGLLHDIGKAIDHEVEGNHVEIGVNLLKKFKEKKEVIHAVEAHHGDIEATTLEAIIVQAADTISAARPGARTETLVSYVQRLEDLENIANSFEGVDRSYAIQAGREVRVMVKPDIVNDESMYLLTKEIAKKIEDELEYPGNIKVNVIRETRQVEFAK